MLDKIDEIVPPGVNLNPADGGWPNPGLEPRPRRAAAKAAGQPHRRDDSRRAAAGGLASAGKNASTDEL